MVRLKKALLKLTGLVIVLIGINYFFAHFAFNNMLNKFAETLIAPESKISFSSYISLLPKPTIHINELNFKAKDDSQLGLGQLTGRLNTIKLISDRQLIFTDLQINDLSITLNAKEFDQTIKSFAFQTIRDGIGVPTTPGQKPVDNFLIKNITLTRKDGLQQEVYRLSTIFYNNQGTTGINACFPSNEAAQQFFRKFIAQYVIAAKLKNACIVFNKPKPPIDLTTPKKALKTDLTR